jgi:hypothetical protein
VQRGPDDRRVCRVSALITGYSEKLSTPAGTRAADESADEAEPQVPKKAKPFAVTSSHQSGEASSTVLIVAQRPCPNHRHFT